jgi:hypothetical protein
MAASTMRVVRRPKGSPARRALTAASQPVDDPQKSFRTAVGAVGRADWQSECWDMYDAVGELRYYVGWRAASCSRVKLIPSEIDPNTGLPTGGLTEDANGNLNAEQQRVVEIVMAVAGGALGQAELQKRSAECLTVPGEHWVALLDRGERNPDGTPRHSWFALTRDEIKAKAGGGAEIELPDGEKHDYKPGVDGMFRVWNSRARRAKEADSPVRATLDSLREIVRTTKKIKNADKSRLIGNGIIFLPQELSLPAAQSPVAANQPGAPLPVVQGVPAADQLSNLLYNVAKVAVEDEDSQAAFIPVMATVPGEHLQKITHLKFGNEITDVEIKKRNDAIARLAMGLDVSPERLLGVGTNSNHWSAWQIGDEDVQLHIKPVMQTLCQAIYEQVVKATLQAEGIDPAKYVLWFDASQLTADPDLTDEAKDASDRGAITNEALRRYYGLSDDDGYDLTTLEGAQEWARDAITKDPTLIRELSPLLDGELAAIDWPAPPAALPPGQQDQNGQPVDNTGQEPNTENQNPQDNQDQAAHVATAAELALAERLLVSRALELAGKRRANTNALKARLSGVAAHDYHRYLPPVTEAEIPKLIHGWDTALEDEVIASLGVDTETLRATVRAQVRRELTRPVVDVVDGQVV